MGGGSRLETEKNPQNWEETETETETAMELCHSLQMKMDLAMEFVTILV